MAKALIICGYMLVTSPIIQFLQPVGELFGCTRNQPARSNLLVLALFFCSLNQSASGIALVVCGLCLQLEGLTFSLA